MEIGRNNASDIRFPDKSTLGHSITGAILKKQTKDTGMDHSFIFAQYIIVLESDL